MVFLLVYGFFHDSVSVNFSDSVIFSIGSNISHFFIFNSNFCFKSRKQQLFLQNLCWKSMKTFCDKVLLWFSELAGQEWSSYLRLNSFTNIVKGLWLLKFIKQLFLEINWEKPCQWLFNTYYAWSIGDQNKHASSEI